MHIVPTLIPIVFFLIAVAVMVGRVLLFVRGARLSITDVKAGKSVHIATPLGSLDLKPHAERDPALATIPLFPGAASVTPKAEEYEADIVYRGKSNRYISSAYTTEGAATDVWQFYRNALTDWQEDPHYQAGRRLSHPITGGELRVEIRRQGSCTLIQHSAQYRASTPDTRFATASSSDPGFALAEAAPSAVYRKEDPGAMPGMDNRFGTGEIKPK